MSDQQNDQLPPIDVSGLDAEALAGMTGEHMTLQPTAAPLEIEQEAPSEMRQYEFHGEQIELDRARQDELVQRGLTLEKELAALDEQKKALAAQQEQLGFAAQFTEYLDNSPNAQQIADYTAQMMSGAFRPWEQNQQLPQADQFMDANPIGVQPAAPQPAPQPAAQPPANPKQTPAPAQDPAIAQALAQLSQNNAAMAQKLHEMEQWRQNEAAQAQARIQQEKVQNLRDAVDTAIVASENLSQISDRNWTIHQVLASMKALGTQDPRLAVNHTEQKLKPILERAQTSAVSQYKRSLEDNVAQPSGGVGETYRPSTAAEGNRSFDDDNWSQRIVDQFTEQGIL